MRDITQAEFDREMQAHARLVLMSDRELAQEVIGQLALYPVPRPPTIETAIQTLLVAMPDLAARDATRAKRHATDLPSSRRA